ncbi:MAG: hypothetical protein CBC73_01735 [Flavobacteriales bacterium TMED113]|nr:MAG: hypothetical protein CBC73_01735 [Flavobacteriales bacterium TMED113]
MKKLLLLLIIPLLFACNSNKEKNSFVGIWTEKVSYSGNAMDMNNTYTLFSNGSYSIDTTIDDTDLKSLITGTWEEKNGQICFTEEGGFCSCVDYLWISKNQWEYTDESGESSFLTRQ